MKIVNEYDFCLRDFDAWGGAEDTQRIIIAAGKEAEFEDLCDVIFMSATEGRVDEVGMNDFLRYEGDFIFDQLEIDPDDYEED